MTKKLFVLLLPLLLCSSILAQIDNSDIEIITLMDDQSDEFKEAAGRVNDQKIETSSEISTYQTYKGETLMLISYKIYGSYKKWRELYTLNKDIIPSDFDLSHGPLIKYKKPVKIKKSRSRGNPYLIKRGDYLTLISRKVYGTSEKWRSIYDNNKNLIVDPNIIFAGFTLYYIPLNMQGDIAILY